MSMVELSDAERRIAERLSPEAGGAIAISPNSGGVAFTNASQAMDFAKMMALSNSGVRKHLRGNPGACLAIVVQAVEWGVSPYAVANKSYFVNDQIAFESQLVQAVILRRAPIRGRIKFEYSGSGQNRRCKAWARLREDDEIVEYQSPELKDIAVKNSPLWKADPDQQFAYYAGRALCRRHFPDVLLGIYTDDDFAMPSSEGPDTARDVTPPRGILGKLDALAAKPIKAEVVEQAGPDWSAEIESYSNRLGETETDETLVEAIESFGGVFDDAPAEIQAEARKLEAAQKASIERSAQ